MKIYIYIYTYYFYLVCDTFDETTARFGWDETWGNIGEFDFGGKFAGKKHIDFGEDSFLNEFVNSFTLRLSKIV